MKRRTTLKLGLAAAAAGTAAGTLAPAPSAFAGSHGKTAFILAHGSWHGAWCWGLVEPRLNLAGFPSIPIDFPGHGLNAVVPQSFRTRPLDPAAFATEPSALAGIGVDRFADTVIAAADRARAMGAERVFAVGHSMGGVPITFAAARAPEKFTGLVYLAALAPAPGKPAGAYLGLEAQQKESKLGPIVAADPAVVGALRIDPRTEDEAIRKAGKEALAADVDDGPVGDRDAPLHPGRAGFHVRRDGRIRARIRGAEADLHPLQPGPDPRQLHLRRDRRRHERGLALVPDPAHRPGIVPRGDVLQARGARGSPDRRDLNAIRGAGAAPPPRRRVAWFPGRAHRR